MMKSKKVAGTAALDVHAVRPQYSDADHIGARVMTHARLVCDHRADMAIKFIERWAMVAATPDGEDSSGRQRLRRMSATEMVQLACECSNEAFEEFRRRGWSTDVPSIDELVDALQDAENVNT